MTEVAAINAGVNTNINNEKGTLKKCLMIAGGALLAGVTIFAVRKGIKATQAQKLINNKTAEPLFNFTGMTETKMRTGEYGEKIYEVIKWDKNMHSEKVAAGIVDDAVCTVERTGSDMFYKINRNTGNAHLVKFYDNGGIIGHKELHLDGEHNYAAHLIEEGNLEEALNILNSIKV